MNNQTDRYTSVNSAMSAVLRAESEALSQIAECEGTAAQILSAARMAVRDMVRRTEQRISKLHADCAKATAEQIALMDKEAADHAVRAPPAEVEQRMLHSAARAVGRELATPASSDAD